MMGDKVTVGVLVTIVGDAKHPPSGDTKHLCHPHNAKKFHVFDTQSQSTELFHRVCTGGDVVGAVDDNVFDVVCLGGDDVIDGGVGTLIKKPKLNIGRGFGLDNVVDAMVTITSRTSDKEEKFGFRDQTMAG